MGLASAVRLEEETSNQEKLFVQMQFIDEDARMIPDDANVQLSSGKVIEQGGDWDEWGAHMHEFPGTVNDLGDFMSPYHRSLPAYYENADGTSANEAIAGVGSIDLFTANVLRNYA